MPDVGIAATELESLSRDLDASVAGEIVRLGAALDAPGAPVDAAAIADDRHGGAAV